MESDPQSDEVTQDEDISTGEDDIVRDDGEEPSGPDKIGFEVPWVHNTYMQ